MNDLLRLLLIARPLWNYFLLAIGFASITVLSSMGLLGSAAWLLSKAALHPFIYELSVAIVSVRFFGLARAVSRYLERYVSHKTTFRLLSRLRLQYYRQLEPLLPYGLKNPSKGTLLSQLTYCIDQLQDFYLRAVIPWMSAAVILSFLTAALLYFCPYAAPLPGLAFCFTGYVLPRIANRQSQKYAQSIHALQLQQKSLLLDLAEGSEELLFYGLKPRYEQKLAKLHEEMNRIQKTAARTTAIENALTAFVLPFFYWLLLLVLVYTVQEAIIDGIWLAAILFFTQGSFEAALVLPSAWRHAHLAKENAQILFSLPVSPKIAQKRSAGSSAASFDLSVQNLCFSYLPGQPVLTDISFELPAGKRLAIIGESGSGKSTLLSILTGFLSCTSGRIQLGGADIHQIPADGLPCHFSALTQEHHLFKASIERNLRIANPHAPLEQCNKALVLAALTKYSPLKTAAHDNGLLSGGESQRLGLARVFLHNAPIYLLDEPFAHLDAKTAHIAAQSILEKTTGHSLLLITHSFIGLEAMDEILVLAKGRIIERGTFTELLKNKAWFYQLFKSRDHI